MQNFVVVIFLSVAGAALGRGLHNWNSTDDLPVAPYIYVGTLCAFLGVWALGG